jgi:hypothetical protein
MYNKTNSITLCEISQVVTPFVRKCYFEGVTIKCEAKVKIICDLTKKYEFFRGVRKSNELVFQFSNLNLIY